MLDLCVNRRYGNEDLIHKKVNRLANSLSPVFSWHLKKIHDLGFGRLALLLFLLALAMSFALGGESLSKGKSALAVLGIWAVLVWLFRLLWPAEEGESKAERPYPLLLLAVAVALGFGLFVLYHVASERYVRFWDGANYWKATIAFMEQQWGHTRQMLDHTYWTIQGQDYNDLPVLLAAPLLALTGLALPGYTLALYLAYLLPALVLAARLARLVQQEAGTRGDLTIPAGYLATAMALLPAVFMPILDGLVDAVCLPTALLLLALAHRNRLECLTAGQVLALALLVALLPLSRRYFSIYIVGFYAAYGGWMVLRLINEKEYTFKIFLRNGLRVMAPVGLALGIWLLFFRGFFTRSFLQDYATLYKSYQFGTAGDNFWWTVSHFGPVVLVGAALGFLLGGKQRAYALFLWAHMALTYWLITRIQTMGAHHYLLFIGQLGVLLVLAGLGLWQRSRMGLYALWLLLAINFLRVLTPTPFPVPQWAESWFSDRRMPPRQRNDLDELRRVKAYVENLPGIAGKQVYFLGSSFAINFDVLRNLNLPYALDALPAMVHPSEVDRRDPFPRAFPQADYVLMATPLQLHLPLDGQQVVAELVRAMQDTTMLAPSYRLLTTFSLIEGIQLHLYEKVAPWPGNAAEHFRLFFKERYPDFKASYEVDDFGGRLFARSTPPGYGRAGFDGDSVLYIHPGRDEPAGISISTLGYNEVTIVPTFYGPCSEGAATTAQVFIDGKLELEIPLDAAGVPKPIRLPLTGTKILRVDLAAGPKADLCDGMKWRFYWK